MSRVRSKLDRFLHEPGSAGRSGHTEIDDHVEAVERRLAADWEDGSAPYSDDRWQVAKHHDAAGGTGKSAAEQSQDLARIRASLDRLAGTIRSISSAPQARSGAAGGDRRTPSASDRQPAGYRGGRAEVRQEDRPGHDMREEMAALRRELGAAVAAMNGDRTGAQLHDDLRRMAEAVERIEQRESRLAASSSGMREELADELNRLRGAVEEIAARPQTRIELSELADAIENGYADLAARLETAATSWLTEARQSAGGAEFHSQLGALADHVGTIRDAIDSLPGRLPVAAMESRLEDLAKSIHELAGSDERSLARHFSEIDARLDEITRALVAVSAEPGGSDALDRIEARIATLAKSIEALTENVREDAHGAAESFAGDVKAALEAIDARLAGMTEATAARPGEHDSIASQIMRLSEKLDNLPAFGAAATQLGGDESELLARLDDIASRLDRLDERTAAFGEAQTAPAAGDAAELTAMLQSLGDRVEELAKAKPGRFPKAQQIAALETQLAGIVSQLETLSGSGFDLSPLSERLDSIEQQVAHSRDIAIDVASQAAERAVGLAAGAGGIDPQLIDALREELKNLDASSRDIGARNEEAFQSVHEALSAIADRLGEIETRMHGSLRHEQDRGYLQEALPDGSASAPPPEGDDIGLAEMEDANTSVRRSEADIEAPPSERSEASADADTVADLPPIGEAPSLDMEESAPAEVEDVPLEPGSGAPDLAALVRRASEKRKAADKAGAAPGTSDLIAAARRAAQAAAQDAAILPGDRPKGEAPKAGAKRLSGLKGLLAKHRKVLLMASAVALIALLAMPIASRFLGTQNVTVDLSGGPAMEPRADSGRDVATAIPVDPLAAGSETGRAMTEAPDSGAPSATPEVHAMPPKSEALDAQPSVKAPGETAEDAPLADAPSGAETVAGNAEASPETDGAGLAAGLDEQASETKAEEGSPVPGEAITQAPMPPAEIGNVALRQAAAAGDGQALFEVARRYTDGDGVERDLVKAAEWYEYSARSGFALAQYRLGNFYEKGHGIAADIGKAVLWYQRAAEQGNALAMHNLAVLFTSGLAGGAPDMEAAVEWFTQAAELGVKDSQVNLGILYTRGMGTRENLVEAYKWFAVAARAGDTDAAAKRDMLANSMASDQLEKARGLAELWKPATVDPAANSAVVMPEWQDAGGRAAIFSNVDTVSSVPKLVERVQTLLVERGFDPGPADGLAGRKTRDAVKAFQASAGMPADGEITKELVRALENGSA